MNLDQHKKLTRELIVIDYETNIINLYMLRNYNIQPDMRIAMSTELLFLTTQRKDVSKQIMELSK